MAQSNWTGEFLVRFDPNVSSETLMRSRSVGSIQPSLNGEDGIVKIRPSAQSSRSLASALAALRAMPGVLEVEPNWIYRKTQSADPLFAQQWGLSKVKAPQVWNSITGLGVVVAVVDTGVDTNHPEFAGRIIPGSNFTSGSSADFADRNGHGTHVAGIIGAAAGNGQGGCGIAPNVMIMPVKVLNDQGSGTTDTVMAGIKFATDNGAKVINLSIGGSQNSTMMANAIKDAWARGVVVVGAAGNENSSNLSYPGAQDEVLCVGATNTTDQRASFSNFGSWVDVAAPGTSILSTLPDNKYGSMQGTSMATPFVAGQAALIWQSIGLAATPQQVRNRIEQSALNIGTWLTRGRIQIPESLTIQSTPTVTTSEHFPTQVRTTVGSSLTSVLQALTLSDNTSLNVRSTALGRNRPAALFTSFTLAPRAPASNGTVQLTMELSANTTLFAQISFFEPGTKQWKTMRNVRLTPTDQTVEIPVANLSRWLSNGTMQVAVSTQITNRSSFDLRFDLVRIVSTDGNPIP